MRVNNEIKCRDSIGSLVTRLTLFAAVASSIAGAEAFAAEPQTIVRVEEDWVLVVGAPDANSIAPQICCTISPPIETDAPHATLELNHHSRPDFVVGGIQLQTWNDEWPLTYNSIPSHNILEDDGEVISWTQTMAIEDGALKFEVVNGASKTWGGFGGAGHLRASVASGLSNLNGYSPDATVQNSGVSLATHRVRSLMLKQVRLITSTGEVVVDDTPRVVHASN